MDYFFGKRKRLIVYQRAAVYNDDNMELNQHESPDKEYQHDELAHLEKHEELKSQFDYSYTQANVTSPLPQATEPAHSTSTHGAPLATTLPTNSVLPEKIPVNSKIGPLTNWVIIIAVFAVQFFAGMYLNDAMFRGYIQGLWLLFIFLFSAHIHNLYNSDKKFLDDTNRKVALVIFGIGTIIAQVAYYFALRKSKPALAHTLARLGWKVFSLWIVYIIIFLGAYIGNTWEVKHAPQFNEIVSAMKRDAEQVQPAIRNNDMAAIQEWCKKVAAKTRELRKVPAYPDAAIQAKIVDSENKLERGASGCVKGIDGNDVELTLNSAQTMSDGTKNLSEAIKAINSKQ